MNRLNISQFLLFLWLSPLLMAQNLIDNGGFETYTALPNNVMQSNLCVGWSKCHQGGGGTPDYFHTNATGLVQLPNSFYATLNPHSGNAVMGIIAYHGVSTDYREYIAHQFNSPLVVGAAYQLTYWISNGQYNGNYGGSGCNHLGVAFSLSEPQQNSTLPLNISPQFTTNSVLYDTNWQQLSYTFYPDSAYQYIVLGNFQDNANTQIQNFENNPIAIAYYFIDDVSLTRIDDNVGLAEVPSAPVRFIYDQNTQSINLTGTEIPQENVEIYNLSGKKMWCKPLLDSEIIDIQSWPKGIYFYRFISKNAASQGGKFVKY